MAQITLYIDEGTLKKIEMAAKREHQSISQWVKNRILKTFTSAWPENYFKVLGSLKNEDLSRPPQPPLKNDVPRKIL